MKFRAQHAELQGLTGLCGDTVDRKPPPEELLLELRRSLADVLGVAHDTVDRHHPASPWRYELVKGIQQDAGDPDTSVGEWLENGAPMGLSVPIVPGGLFPEVVPDPELSLEELELSERWDRNHPSFQLCHGEAIPPGLDLIAEYVEKGMGRLFAGAKEASTYLNHEIHPAPMGNVTTVKSGKTKHRVIQDLRANRVNSAVVLPERQVLPRGVDHALDMALLSSTPSKGSVVEVMVLDFKDAFMSIPLDDREKKYNCGVLPENICRKREGLDEEEPEAGACIVWNVLGFGGKPNPLVYSRVASLAMRSAQAMFSRSAADGPWVRSQLYVDDPAVTARGSPEEVQLAFDLILCWWMALGIPLAWKKGSVVRGSEPHEWIGVSYEIPKPGRATMKLPVKYLEDLLLILNPFCSQHGRASLKDAERMVGKASRVAQVVPSARPFVSGLWAALTASKKDIAIGKNRTKGTRIATRRFVTAARWFKALIEGSQEALLPLTREVLAHKPARASTSGWVAQFDASTSGGGAVLRCGQKVVAYFMIEWTKDTARHLDVVPNSSRHQTFWEFLVVLLVLCTWGNDFKKASLAVVGDNTGALTNSLKMQGKGNLAAIAREIAWRSVRNEWAFEVGHIPSELNVVPDALSRQFEAHKPVFPHEALSDAKRVHPDLKGLWKAGGL